VFDATIDSGELTAGDDEVHALRWVPPSEIAALDLDPLNRELLRDVGVIGT
jgi:8-oxo-dGTP pyrophosphatase MutT (NUDIX family)